MIMQIQPLTLLLCLWLAFEISSCERLDFRPYIQRVDWFQEGIILELYCTQDTTNNINIQLTNRWIVEGSHLVDGVSDGYEFQKNSTVSVFVIKALSRNDDGTYYCSEAGLNIKAVSVKVLYSPSEKSPQCMSNYDSPVIIDALRQDYINFTCISDQGNPPVSVKADILLSKTSSTNIADICSENKKVGKSTSFSCHMNESLNNATFHCNVTQQFPNPYSSGCYSGSCSFGPLHFLPSFSIKINEANVTVQQGQSFNLTCTTNVRDVDINWIGIPEDWGYTVMRDDYFSFVWIENVHKQSTSEINVHCIGYYGNKNVTDSVKVNIINLQSGKTTLVFLILVVTICLITCISAGVFIVCFHWRKTGSNIHKQRVDQATYTTTVMAPNNIIGENTAELQGSQEYDHSIVTSNSPGDNSNTKYYEIPLQSSRLDVNDSGYLVPTSSHPQAPMYQYVDHR